MTIPIDYVALGLSITALVIALVSLSSQNRALVAAILTLIASVAWYAFLGYVLGNTFVSAFQSFGAIQTSIDAMTTVQREDTLVLSTLGLIATGSVIAILFLAVKYHPEPPEEPDPIFDLFVEEGQL